MNLQGTRSLLLMTVKSVVDIIKEFNVQYLVRFVLQARRRITLLQEVIPREPDVSNDIYVETVNKSVELVSENNWYQIVTLKFNNESFNVKFKLN